MTAAHKAALSEGRNDSRAVSAYLEALDTQKPKRGPRKNPAAIQAELASIEKDLTAATPMERVLLIQKRLDLQAALTQTQTVTSIQEVEDAFVKVCARYSERKGLTKAAWREAGVPAAVLSKAGL